MVEMLNPGVYVTEINASTIAPTVSTSVGVFAGDFVKGPVGIETLITSVADLITFYGQPTSTNYNDFYQAYNFLQYGNKLLLSRASNINGISSVVVSAGANVTVSTAVLTGASASIAVTAGTAFAVGDAIAFDGVTPGVVDLQVQYTVTAVVANTITIDRLNQAGIALGSLVHKIQRSMNAVQEAVSTAGTLSTNGANFGTLSVIENPSDFDSKYPSIPFSNINAKIKFIARNPGTWGNSLQICIATPTAFGAATASEAFTGIPLDGLFEYPPIAGEFGIAIHDGTAVVETWIVSLDPTAKDHNNKSIYVETLLNTRSAYVFAKNNVTNTTALADAMTTVNGVASSLVILGNGADSPIQTDDLLNAYDIFSNKEYVDIDIVIGNELDDGVSANNLCTSRADCIGFLGARYSDVVGQKSALAVGNLVTQRKTGVWNINSQFLVAVANYKYQYDKFLSLISANLFEKLI